MATFNDIPGFKCRPHPPHDPVLYATAVAAPRNTRSPKGLPVREPLGSMWHDPKQLQHVHPEALGSPSGCVVPTGHRLLRPHPSLCIPPRGLWIRHGGGCTQGTRLEVGIQRVPNLLRWTGLTCRLPYPGGPKGARGCCFPSGVSLHPFVKGSATTMVLSRLQSSLQVTARELASPPFRGRLRSSWHRCGSPRIGVEYDYVGKQPIPTAGLSPASPPALWAAQQTST